MVKNRFFAVLLFAALAVPCFAGEGFSCPACIVFSGIPPVWWLAPIASVAALIIAFFFYKRMMADPEGNEKMVSIAGYVREGAYAYLITKM